VGGKAKKQREQRSGGQKAHANHCAHVHNDSQSLLAVLMLDAQKIMTPGLLQGCSLHYILPALLSPHNNIRGFHHAYFFTKFSLLLNCLVAFQE
jgi:hypothetical protein